MILKPDSTIASKLRGTFNTTGRTIKTAIPDEVAGPFTLLRLYCENSDGLIKAYKDPERTEEYSSYEDALSAINAADLIVARYYNSTTNPPRYEAGRICTSFVFEDTEIYKEVVAYTEEYIMGSWERIAVFLYRYEASDNSEN